MPEVAKSDGDQVEESGEGVMKKLAFLLLFLSGVVWGTDEQWQVRVSTPQPCPSGWGCSEVPVPYIDYELKQIVTHANTEDACKDMAEALNEAHSQREWNKKTEQEKCESQFNCRYVGLHTCSCVSY